MSGGEAYGTFGNPWNFIVTFHPVSHSSDSSYKFPFSPIKEARPKNTLSLITHHASLFTYNLLEKENATQKYLVPA